MQIKLLCSDDIMIYEGIIFRQDNNQYMRVEWATKITSKSVMNWL